MPGVFPNRSSKRQRHCDLLPAIVGDVLESRAMLSHVGHYTVPTAAEVQSQNAPQATTPEDFSGTWNSDGVIIALTQKNAKIKGTASNPSVLIGNASVKAKVDGDQMVGQIKGKGVFDMVGVAKFKLSFDVSLTDATHFEGSATTVVKGMSVGPFPFEGTKI